MRRLILNKCRNKPAGVKAGYPGNKKRD